MLHGDYEESRLHRDQLVLFSHQSADLLPGGLQPQAGDRQHHLLRQHDGGAGGEGGPEYHLLRGEGGPEYLLLRAARGAARRDQSK